MSDNAPERIWAFPRKQWQAEPPTVDQFPLHPTEYVRLDLHLYKCARIEAQAALIAELTEALLIIRNDAELTSTGRTSFLGKIMRTADAAISKAKD